MDKELPGSFLALVRRRLGMKDRARLRLVSRRWNEVFGATSAGLKPSLVIGEMKLCDGAMRICDVRDEFPHMLSTRVYKAWLRRGSPRSESYVEMGEDRTQSDADNTQREDELARTARQTSESNFSEEEVKEISEGGLRSLLRWVSRIEWFDYYDDMAASFADRVFGIFRAVRPDRLHIEEVVVFSRSLKSVTRVFTIVALDQVEKIHVNSHEWEAHGLEVTDTERTSLGACLVQMTRLETLILPLCFLPDRVPVKLPSLATLQYRITALPPVIPLAKICIPPIVRELGGSKLEKLVVEVRTRGCAVSTEEQLNALVVGLERRYREVFDCRDERDPCSPRYVELFLVAENVDDRHFEFITACGLVVYFAIIFSEG